MNPRHWRHFLAIADSGGFSRAADALNVPQPVLSREMRDLEATLGASLFDRHARGVTLTSAGVFFRRRAESLLIEIQRLPEEIAAAQGALTGALSVGFPPSLAGVVAGPAVAAFRQRAPGVSLHIREAASIGLRDALNAREIELGVLTIPIAEPRLTLRPLATEGMVLVGAPDAGLDPGRPVAITDLAGLPLILARRPNSTRIVIEHALEAQGARPDIVIEIDNAPIAEFIRRGLGYTVVPASFTISNPGLAHAPIKGLEIGWTIATPADAKPSRAAGLMIGILVDATAQAISSGRWPASRER